MSFLDKYDHIIGPLMGIVRRFETLLGPEDDWVEDDRRALFQAAQRHLGHLHTFVYEKGPADYVTTVHADSDVVEETLMPPYQRNLLSARKYRVVDGRRQYACGSFVIDGIEGPHGYAEQHHVYLFEAPNGGTDVYAHRETSVTEGAEHLTDSNQEHGDPHVLFDVFDRAELEYGHRSV